MKNMLLKYSLEFVIYDMEKLLLRHNPSTCGTSASHLHLYFVDQKYDPYKIIKLNTFNVHLEITECLSRMYHSLYN